MVNRTTACPLALFFTDPVLCISHFCNRLCQGIPPNKLYKFANEGNMQIFLICIYLFPCHYGGKITSSAIVQKLPLGKKIRSNDIKRMRGQYPFQSRKIALSLRLREGSDVTGFVLRGQIGTTSPRIIER